MNDAQQEVPRPRRPFLEPQPQVPFLKTREGRLIVGLGVLCVLCGIAAFVQYQRTQAAVERATAERLKAEAQAAAVPEVSLDDRLAKRRAELLTSYEGAFADTANGDEFVETAGYAKLIELLASMTPEATVAKAGGQIGTPNGNDSAANSANYLDYPKVVAQPDLYRGEFLRVRGLVGGLYAVKLERPVHDITDVWRGTVAQPDGSEAVVFDFIGTPPAFESQRTVLEVDGLLYRMVSYESKTHLTRTSPYLLVRSIREIQATSPTATKSKVVAILMGLLAIGGYLLLRTALRGRKEPFQGRSRLKSMYLERQRAQREDPR